MRTLLVAGGLMLAMAGFWTRDAAAQSFPTSKPFFKAFEPRKAPAKPQSRSRRMPASRTGAKPSPAPAPEPAPLPKTEPAPAPEPAPLPKTEPAPAPEPAPLPKTEPAPAPEPAPLPKTSPAPTPEPAPLPKTEPAPAPEPASSPKAGRPPAENGGKAGAAPLMLRVDVPAGAWNAATQAAMFAPGRLIPLDDFPALGTRLTGGAAAVNQSPAPSSPQPPAELADGGADTPLPRPKNEPPDIATLPLPPPAVESDPDCADLDAAGIVGTLAPAIEPTPAGCAIPHPVNITAVRTSAGVVALKPGGLMRCAAARAIAAWVREDMAPLARDKLGAELKTVQTASSYVCRPRNHVSGAQLSEHGRGTALDIAGFTFSDGKTIVIGQTDDKGFSQAVRLAACKHLTTVLGPGTDVEHGNHLHVDLKIRKGGYRICQ